MATTIGYRKSSEDQLTHSEVPDKAHLAEDQVNPSSRSQTSHETMLLDR
jgi:hypothetical protein